MKKYWLAFLVIGAVNPIQAQTAPIYKWTDSNGNIHFTDKPHEGAEEIELPPVQTYSAPQTPITENSSEPVGNEEAGAYEKIIIVQPQDQETIRNPQGYISIILELQPALKKGDKVQMIIDGTPIGVPQEATVFALRDINRGSHTVSAQVTNNQGNALITSDPITIFMMPPRVGMVPH